MSDQFVIVKYAKDYFPLGRAPESHGVGATYTARQCGVTQKVYDSREGAETDLIKLRNYNPSVDYGICIVDNNIENPVTSHIVF